MGSLQTFAADNSDSFKGKDDLNASYAEASVKASQTDKITGKVTDESGEPLPGVSVVIKGTTIGITTDFDGKYTLSVPEGSNTLVFSFVGMLQQEVVIDGQSSLDIVMKQDMKDLDEVVVIGYGVQKKEEVTSSISSVSNDDFSAGLATNTMQVLEGKVAGLNIVRPAGSDPNASPQIRMRGITTVKAGSGPLVIVDGIPGGSLSSVTPEDIESIDVLRDGSAAAIYGTRGTNGVIIITTKKGSEGVSKLEYSSYISTEVVTKKPGILSADEYRALKKDYPNIVDGGTNTDWFDELVETPFNQVHNISLSGGNKNTNYRASINYRDVSGIVINTSRKYLNGRINVNHSALNDKLKTQVILSGTTIDADFTNYGAFEFAARLNPTMSVYNSDGTFWEPTGYGEFNPVAKLKQIENGAKNKILTASVKSDLEILEGLKLGGFLAMDRRDKNGHYYESKFAKGSIADGYNGHAKRDASFTYTNTFETTIDYNKYFGKHRVSLLGGYSYQDFTEEWFNAENKDFLSDAFTYNNLGAGNYIKDGKAGMGSGKKRNKLIAFFGRAIYNYDNKYLLTASVRREGSSKFGANNKWGWFPAVSLGWRLKEEDFLKNADYIDDLKFRVGYGVTGNQDLDEYQSLTRFGAGANYMFNGGYTFSYGPSANPNPDLKWEKKKEFNIGVDFSLFNHKFGGTIDLYNRTTTDLLYEYTAQVPPMIHSSIFTNVGEMNNKGIELALNYNVFDKKDFSWDVDFNISYNKNELVSLSNEFYKKSFQNMGGLPSPGNLGDAYRLQEGVAVGSFFGKKFKGFTEDGKWIFEGQEDGVVSDEDKDFIGNGNPTVFAGLTNTVRYKRFDLTVFLRGAFDYDVLNLKRMYYANAKWLPNNILKEGLTTKLNDDPQYSDYYLEKGDFVKLDNVTLGYTFNVSKIEYLSKCRLYISGQNLAVITDYSGIDPEVGGRNASGLEPGWDGRGFYPRTSIYTLGVNIEF
ncbi:TonB-dependent receptor [Puteibacter caeruleilacunae]|nr:TonB-dependent receptor [Puteibacter caeruleilacunae]